MFDAHQRFLSASAILLIVSSAFPASAQTAAVTEFTLIGSTKDHIDPLLRKRIVAGSAKEHSGFVRGVSYFEDKQFERAIQEFDMVVRSNPASLNSYFYRGRCYIGLNVWPKSIEDFSKALELKPDYTLAYCLRSTCFSEKGEVESALRDCKKAIELEPSKGVGYRTLGYVLAKNGNEAQALAAFNEGILADPKDYDLYQARGTLHYKNKRYKDALADFEKALKLHNAILHLSSRAKARIALREHKLAKQDLDVVCLREPTAEHFRDRAFCERFLGDWTSCKHDCDRVLKVNPKDGYTIYMCAVANRKLGLTKLASSEFDRALSIEPELANRDCVHLVLQAEQRMIEAKKLLDEKYRLGRLKALNEKVKRSSNDSKALKLALTELITLYELDGQLEKAEDVRRVLGECNRVALTLSYGEAKADADERLVKEYLARPLRKTASASAIDHQVEEMLNLATRLIDLDESDLVIPLMERCIQLENTRKPIDKKQLLHLLDALSVCLLKEGLYKRAEPILLERMSMSQNNDRSSLSTALNLARLYTVVGKFDDAQKCFTMSAHLLALRNDDWNAFMFSEYAEDCSVLLRRMGRKREAEMVLNDASKKLGAR